MSEPSVDVLIAGAGVAGAGAAILLARAGLRVTLVDQFATQAPVFRAEKIEPDQAEALRRLGLMDMLLPVCTRIHRVACGQDGAIWKCQELEEYGVFYQDLVNALRARLPEGVRFQVGRVEKVQNSPSLQTVTLADGTVLAARLLILASGALGRLPEQMGMVRETRSAAHSISLGFNLEPFRRFSGDAESLTYRENRLGSGIDYITLFPIGSVLRANMFSFWDVKGPEFQTLRTEGMTALERWLPGLSAVAGSLRISSKIEAMPIHLYRFAQVEQPGVVLLSDLYQSVCPTTGTGLTKVLADLEALVALAPAWLRSPEIGAEQIAAYYRDPRKVHTDDHSLSDAFYRKRLCTDRSPAWMLRRWKKDRPRRWAARSFRPPVSSGPA